MQSIIVNAIICTHFEDSLWAFLCDLSKFITRKWVYSGTPENFHQKDAHGIHSHCAAVTSVPSTSNGTSHGSLVSCLSKYLSSSTSICSFVGSVCNFEHLFGLFAFFVLCRWLAHGSFARTDKLKNQIHSCSYAWWRAHWMDIVNATDAQCCHGTVLSFHARHVHSHVNFCSVIVACSFGLRVWDLFAFQRY